MQVVFHDDDANVDDGEDDNIDDADDDDDDDDEDKVRRWWRGGDRWLHLIDGNPNARRRLPINSRPNIIVIVQ